MHKVFSIIFFLLFSFSLWAQKTTISGVVKDADTGETLIGANVLLTNGIGTVTDFDGKFSIDADFGEYEMVFSYVGYEQTSKKVKVEGISIFLNISLSSQTLTEVTIVADMAKSRETPVAFTNVLPAKIENELAGKDIPMVLNSTPGVYATQQGGGDGDARISIRGFDQRNVAVMIDGIPVNDMENGWVYWSNWFGLDVSTRAIQVQRGLGRSKLAIPSVGGTLNILTKGIEQKAGGAFKQFVDSEGKFQTTIGYNSGRLKSGWGFNVALSYKQGDGYIDQTWTKGYFYFFRVDKRIGKHLISVTGMGAPQEHGQRSYKKSIATFNKDYAGGLSSDENDINYIDTTGVKYYGERYNPHWGYLEKWKWNEDRTDTIHASREKFSEKTNYYHKPQFSIKDLWNISSELTLSNIFYVSIGKGGGTGMYQSISQDGNGQLDFQTVYDSNITDRFNTGGKSGNVMRSSINNHYWFGYLSTLHYQYNSNWTFSGGLDLRSYKGEHYREVYDLLGGKFFIDNRDGIVNHSTTNQKVYKGDKISYWNDGLVRWGGLFGMAEYKTQRWSVFFNISTANSRYKRIDHFGKRLIKLSDTTLAVGIVKQGKEYLKEEVTYNGKTYTIDSPEAKKNETDWKVFWGYTFKGGVNFNIDEYNNVFFNSGYISKAPRFNNVIDNSNKIYSDVKNEKITAFELGYGFQMRKIALNFNAYYTIWDNKPMDRLAIIPNTEDPDNPFKANINGMGALHKGIELDFAYKPIASLDIQGLLSLGDWKWKSKETANKLNDNGEVVGTFKFDAKDVHVGDAAQTQFGGSIKYKFLKNAHLKVQYMYFDRYYAQFDPFSLSGDDAGRDSWQIPSYSLVDLNAGYSFDLWKKNILLNFNVKNLLDKDYISDALNNDQYLANSPKTFDAKSATVFMGLGRMYSASIKIKF